MHPPPDYLSPPPSLADPAVVAAIDQAPLWSARFGELLLAHVPLAGARRVLDLACGTGFPLLELAGRLGPASFCVGLDPWAPALARAALKRQAYAVAAGLVLGDGARLPFAGGAFDLVVINLGLNNFDDPAAVLAECARVIAAWPAARLALTTNLSGHMREFYAVFRETLVQLDLAACLPALDLQEAHRGTPASVAALVQGAGFRVTRVVEDQFTLRYRDGSALLRNWFIRLGFLPGWRGVLAELNDPPLERAVFAEIERRLNQQAAAAGERGLRLRVPMLYLEAKK